MRGAQSSGARSGEAYMHGRHILSMLKLRRVSDDPCACLLTAPQILQLCPQVGDQMAAQWHVW